MKIAGGFCWQLVRSLSVNLVTLKLWLMKWCTQENADEAKIYLAALMVLQTHQCAILMFKKNSELNRILASDTQRSSNVTAIWFSIRIFRLYWVGEKEMSHLWSKFDTLFNILTIIQFKSNMRCFVRKLVAI